MKIVRRILFLALLFAVTSDLDAFRATHNARLPAGRVEGRTTHRRILIPIIPLPPLAGEASEFQYGTIPIILTAPHAGDENPGNFGLRECDSSNFPEDCYNETDEGIEKVGKCCRGGNCSLVASDGRTRQLTLEMAEEIENLFGGRPYYVIAKVKRAYSDFNRDAYSFKTRFHNRHPDVDYAQAMYCAHDDPDATPYWDAYHNTIEAMLDHMQRQFGSVDRALMLEIHGNNSNPGALILGMGTWTNSSGVEQVGESLPNMRSRDESLPFLFAPGGISGFVRRLGFWFVLQRAMEGYPQINPDIFPHYVEETNYSLKGGYGVQRYSRAYTGTVSWGGPQSSATEPMIDVIQLEYGSKLRKCQNSSGDWRFCDEAVESSAKATAKALFDSWGLR